MGQQIAKNLRLFFLGAYLSFIALFVWLRPSAYLAAKIAAPLFHMIFFVLLGRFVSGQEDASFYVIGNAMQTVALSGLYGVSMSIWGDRWNGTLLYLLGTPANRISLFLGRGFMHILDGALGIIIGFLWGILLFRLNLAQANLPGLAIIILVTTISISGLGLVIGSLGLITRNIEFASNVLFFSLFIFSGANIRLETLPQWVQAISAALPLSRGIAAARLAVDGATFAELTPLLSGELLIGLAYALAGFGLFHWFETRAKRWGTLEAF